MKVCDKDSQINYGKVKEDLKKLGGLMEMVIGLVLGLVLAMPLLVVMVGLFVLEPSITDILLFNNHIGLVGFDSLDSFNMFGFEIWTLHLIMLVSFIVSPWIVYKIVAMYVEDYKNDRETFNAQMKVLMVGAVMVGIAFEFLFYFYPPNPATALLPKEVVTMVTILLFAVIVKQGTCKRYTIKK